MSLRERIDDDIKQAMRDRDELSRDTLRMIVADLKNALVDLRTKSGKVDVALSDDDVVRVLQKGVKSRQESVTQYEAAGREELAKKERAEIAVIERYLPKLLDEAETKAAVAAAVAEVGASTKADLGKIMKALMARFPGRIDGKLAQRLAGEHLS